jgi:uncharacterized membrane protein
MSGSPGIFSNLTASTINGGVVALSSEITQATPPNNKVVTPYALKTYLSSLPSNVPIVGTSATFSSLSASSISGNVVPTSLSNYTSQSTLITPYTLSAAFANPEA